MADREDFNRKKDKINAFPIDKAKGPGIPVRVLSQESEMLFDWVQEDKSKFLQVNIDWKTVENLPAITGATRYLDAIWRNMRLRQADAQKEWEKLRLEGFETREELFAAMELAFDGDDDLMQRLEELRIGESQGDMIADVGALAELGREQQALLSNINYDMTIVENAAKLADRMAKLLGEADSAKLKDSEEKVLRNKAYTLLTNAMRKIRKCGKYVNRNEPERLKGYTSGYSRSRNRNYRRKQEVQEVEMQATV